MQQQFDSGPGVWKLNASLLQDPEYLNLINCQWAEEGETSSSYFLNLESKHHARQTMYSIRDPATGLVRHDPFEILGVWRAYYDTLFTAQACDVSAQDTMLSQLTRRLSQAERAGCEGCLTVD